jgi:L-amino acid N-acyltransferase YncA
MRECAIRPATLEDMPAVAAIYQHFVVTSTATLDLEPPEAAEMVRRLEAVQSQGLPYLVAELEGYIVGYCYASRFRPRDGYRLTVEDSIYVRADCIGYGVGRRLLQELIASCQKDGCHQMIAVICGDNPVSVALHASQGFRQAGSIPEAGFKFGQWVDIMLMQRAL